MTGATLSPEVSELAEETNFEYSMHNSSKEENTTSMQPECSDELPPVFLSNTEVKRRILNPDAAMLTELHAEGHGYDPQLTIPDIFPNDGQSPPEIQFIRCLFTCNFVKELVKGTCNGKIIKLPNMLPILRIRNKFKFKDGVLYVLITAAITEFIGGLLGYNSELIDAFVIGTAFNKSLMDE